VVLEVNSKNSMIGAIFGWLIMSDEAFIGLTISWSSIMSIRARSTKSNGDALAAFISSKAEIDTMLARLQAHSDEHFGYSSDEITWSHVGTLEHYAELLQRITDSAFNEGKHAA
jgi:hypothetical protein